MKNPSENNALTRLVAPGGKLPWMLTNGSVVGRDFRRRGFTLLELILVIVIFGLISVVAVPSYKAYVDRSRLSAAQSDIRLISMALTRFRINNNDRLPDSLTEVSMDTMLDPYGRPYEYLNIENATNAGKGNMRKDRNLVPINSDYDLYSVGADGKSVGPLTAKASRDDIVRANDGAFVGLASDY